MTATLVQTKTGSTVNTSSALVLPLASNTSTGDTVIIAVTMDNNVDVISSITATGMTFNKITSASGTNSDTFAYISVWYAFNVTGATTPSIMVNKSQTMSMEAVVFHYSGLTTIDPLDKVARATGSSVSPASGNTTTLSQANEVIIGITGSDFGGATYTVGAGYGHLTQITANGNSEMALQDKQVSATTAISSSMTLSNSASWAASVITMKIASTGSIGSIAGSATVTGVAKALAYASGSSVGSSNISGVVKALSKATGSSTGTATVKGVSTKSSSIGRSTGMATVSGTGKAIAYITGSSIGIALLNIIGQSSSSVSVKGSLFNLPERIRLFELPERILVFNLTRPNRTFTVTR